MNKKLIIIIAVVAVVLIGGGVGAFMVLSGGGEKEPVVVYQEYQMEEMYTNIKDPGKILKFQLSVEYTNPELAAEFEKNKSKLVNNVYEYFRNTEYESLSKTNGQERAREDIRDIIVETMGVDAESITNVYFIQFIIQG
jgi:flagellar FliL protein